MKDIFETIEKYHMIEPGMQVAVGISGGADSVCLLYVLKEYQKQVLFSLAAVHVEHGIRGAESLADAEFTEKLCSRMGIPCEVHYIKTEEIARVRGFSVEEAGRAERYRIFEDLCRESRADRIAVAHNQNDQAETMLWNLARGSGLQGLGGIRPVRDRIIRPLLFTDRGRIEQILREAGLSWRTDATNLKQDYTRNRIRLSLIPKMEEELNAQAGLHIAQAAQKLQQVQGFLERMTEQAAQTCMLRQGDVVLLLEPFGRQDELIQTELLRMALKECRRGKGLKDISSVHLQMLLQLTRMDCGKECMLPGIRAVREKGRIRFFCTEKSRQNGRRGSLLAEEMPEKPEYLLLNKENGSFAQTEMRSEENRKMRLTLHILDNHSSVMQEIQEEKKYTKWISYDTIISGVRLRKRKPGDYLIINDAGGRKKLRDYFIDAKIPRGLRDEIWLVADGSHILWVIGYRISAGAKVTQETKKILKIQAEEVCYERES